MRQIGIIIVISAVLVSGISAGARGRRVGGDDVFYMKRQKMNDTVSFRVDSLYYDGDFKGCEIRIPVSIGGKTEYLILDNGCAQYSLASESFAMEHGFCMLGQEGEAVGTVDRVPMELAVADSLSIGREHFFNVVFVVIPDRYLENPVTEIDAVLGANIFNVIGEMDFDNVSRTVVFPYRQRKFKSNVIMDGDGTHYIKAEVNGEKLVMQLDLGAADTGLNSNYFEKHRGIVQSTCKPDTIRSGGVGGVEKSDIYRMPVLSLEACGGQYELKNAKIFTEKKPIDKNEDGYVGVDFLLSFDKAVINLRKMFLYVNPRQ